jgi:predicted secreted protein
MTVSASDNGKTIKMQAGESVMLRLPVQLGTGYSWQPPKPGKQDLFLVEPEKSTSQAIAEPGSKEIQVFRLIFTQTGQADVVFQYRRAWDEKTSPAKTFRIKVEVEK